MKNSCISESYSLGKPENYIFTMHILTCFEVPINVFGAYCILFKTPKRMASVKWPMLVLHCLCSLNDFYISFLTIPYIYFPMLAGLPLGVWNAPLIEIFLLVLLLGGLVYQRFLQGDILSESGAAILSIFENRYYIIFGINSSWKQIRKPFLTFNYLLTPIALIPVFLMIPEQDTALAKIHEVPLFRSVVGTLRTFSWCRAIQTTFGKWQCSL